MKMNGYNGFGLILVVLGGLMLLSLLGFSMGAFIGAIMSWVFPLALIGLGYLGIRSGRAVIGWILVVIGVISLAGKLSGLLGWILAAALIFWGLSLLKRKPTSY